MARAKRQSDVVTNAGTRAAALAAIDKNLDLGNGLTLSNYNVSITNTQKALDSYNTKLAEVDDANNTLKSMEKILSDLTSRMLKGVEARFGRDSSQYEQAGGTRTSERKKRVAKAKPAAK